MNFLSQGFQKLSFDIHTYIHTDRQTVRDDRNYTVLCTTPLRGWSIIIRGLSTAGTDS